MIATDEYVNFLIDNNITQEQLLLLILMYEERVDLIRAYKKQFPNNTNNMISPYLISDLIEKDFLLKKEGTYYLGESFLAVFISPSIAVDEIYDIYPTFMKSDKEVNIPLTTMDKRVFKELYIPKIKGNRGEHKEVIKDIEYGIEHSLLRMGINKFVNSEFWKAIRKERIKDIDMPVSKTNDDF